MPRLATRTRIGNKSVTRTGEMALKRRLFSVLTFCFVAACAAPTDTELVCRVESDSLPAQLLLELNAAGTKVLGEERRISLGKEQAWLGQRASNFVPWYCDPGREGDEDNLVRCTTNAPDTDDEFVRIVKVRMADEASYFEEHELRIDRFTGRYRYEARDLRGKFDQPDSTPKGVLQRWQEGTCVAAVKQF